MPPRHLAALACAICPAIPAAAGQTAAETAPASAPAPLPEELVLEGDAIVTVLLDGVPLRLAVRAEAFGAPIVNPDVATRLALAATGERGWRYGPVVVTGSSTEASADFGAGPTPLTVSWADRPVIAGADGVIGVHALPYARVTFAYRLPHDDEVVQRFALKRSGGRANTRLGTEVGVGKRRLMMIFAPERRENLVTAPTANFIATHQEGGFEPDSQGIAAMDFGVERPTRTMRIAVPVALGSLIVDRFAVRIEDYGQPNRVGEIAADDPRFDPDNILVSARKGRGRPDLLTRIGGDQIAHCSRLTYDLAGGEIRLSCRPAPL